MENYLRITGTKEQLDEAVMKLCGKKNIIKFKPGGSYLKKHPLVPPIVEKEKAPVEFEPGFNNEERLISFKTNHMPPFMLYKGVTKQFPDIEMEYAYMDDTWYPEVGHGFYKAGKAHDCECKEVKPFSPQRAMILYEYYLQGMKYN